MQIAQAPGTFLDVGLEICLPVAGVALALLEALCLHEGQGIEDIGGRIQELGVARGIARYQTRFQPIVEMRLRQAGVRLAKLIAAAMN